MTTTLTKTDAELLLPKQFAAVAAELPGGGWVPEARSRAMRVFEKAGLPHRRIEAWKYTDLRNELRTAFPPAKCLDIKGALDLLPSALGPELAGLACIRLVLVNGRYLAKAIPTGCELGKEWQFESLAGAIGRPGNEWIRASFEPGGLGECDPIRALNTAFATDGIVLSIADGAALELPIHIVSIVGGDVPVAVATRNLFRIGDGARAAIIESHLGIGPGRLARQATAVTQVSVGKGSEVRHLQHVAGGKDVMHLSRSEIEISARASYRGFQLTAGGKLVRNEARVRFAGPDARLDLSGLMLGRGNDHIDTTLEVDHPTTGCESRELFKAVLDDRARGVFQGKIIVAPEAQKTDGKQMAQALMLSEDAEFDSKPELEIYADDVACGHGSTAAELEPGMLFYLRSRGLPLAEARGLLIESFAAGALDKIEDEAVRDAMRSVALGWLEAAQ